MRSQKVQVSQTYPCVSANICSLHTLDSPVRRCSWWWLQNGALHSRKYPTMAPLSRTTLVLGLSTPSTLPQPASQQRHSKETTTQKGLNLRRGRGEEPGTQW